MAFFGLVEEEEEDEEKVEQDESFDEDLDIFVFGFVVEGRGGKNIFFKILNI